MSEEESSRTSQQENNTINFPRYEDLTEDQVKMYYTEMAAALKEAHNILKDEFPGTRVKALNTIYSSAYGLVMENDTLVSDEDYQCHVHHEERRDKEFQAHLSSEDSSQEESEY